MTKKELIEMLSEVPDNAKILTMYENYNLITNSTVHTIDINGYYEFRGSYVLTAANVRPYKQKDND